ncbi:MAG: flagellar M-ring protein FliF C-terminal domain-containing protein [Planctomycetota bacterium]
MNDAIGTLWSQLRGAGPAARWALGACLGLVLLVSSILVWKARNPHFVVLAADLDAQSFNTAITALAGAGIRYETSMGPPPYVIRVDESKKYEALNAIHLSGEFLGSSRGISSGLDGSSSVFLGQSERHQRTQKRLWEEAEMQLERLNYVAKARVTVSNVSTSHFASMRGDDRRASVVLTLRGLSLPAASQTRALVGIVRGATGVADARITIVDQHSNVVFDGAEAGGTESLMAIEDRFSRERTDAVQALLDRTYGPGLAIVGVTGEWRQVREESISETLDPSKKPKMQRSRTSEEPEWPRQIGGPAGVAANTQEGSGTVVGVGPAGPATATTTEEETAYSFGSKTTHTISQPHQLQRLSISLVVDSSIEENLGDAEALVKGLVGFDETRGDRIASRATDLPGLHRDGEGAPILPEPAEAPKPSNQTLMMALEYGLEIVAGIAFLVLLLRSLRSAKATGKKDAPEEETVIETVVGPDGKRTVTRKRRPVTAPEDDDYDESLDMDALARAHIEELLKTEPEKVSALLSRWALAEDVYAESSSS